MWPETRGSGQILDLGDSSHVIVDNGGDLLAGKVGSCSRFATNMVALLAQYSKVKYSQLLTRLSISAVGLGELPTPGLECGDRRPRPPTSRK